MDETLRGIYRYNKPSINDMLSWETFDKYKTGIFIPFIGYNILKMYPKTAWHIKSESQNPHSIKYIIKKSICDNNLYEFSKIIKKSNFPEETQKNIKKKINKNPKEKKIFNFEKEIDLEKKMTPLHLASKFNRINMVKYLIFLGANLNKKDINGQTPLMYAVDSMSFDCIKILVENGAKIFLKDNFNLSPLDKAEIKNFKSIEFFLKNSEGKFESPELGKFFIRSENVKDIEFFLNFLEEMRTENFGNPVSYPFNNLKGIYLLSMVNKQYY